MQQAFIEIRSGLPVNTDIMCAAEGFEQLGYRIRTFERTDIITAKYRLLYGTCPFVGSIDSMKSLFRSENVMPQHLDFPPSINLGRTVRKVSLKLALDLFHFAGEPVFIKPVETKLFNGMLVDNYDAFNYFTPFLEDDPDCWVSPKLDILSEWRGFVHNGKLVDCRHYAGNFRVYPDMKFLDKAVESCDLAISAYTIDLAVTTDLTSAVIEVNDFWAIGSYGLEPEMYAQMLSDRYFEILG
jgi:hypothetical protein